MAEIVKNARQYFVCKSSILQRLQFQARRIEQILQRLQFQPRGKERNG